MLKLSVIGPERETRQSDVVRISVRHRKYAYTGGFHRGALQYFLRRKERRNLIRSI